MLSHLFLGISLIGAEWVLYFLVALSLLSITLIVERAMFYRTAMKGLDEFRARVRESAGRGEWAMALEAARSRAKATSANAPDLESELAASLLAQAGKTHEVEILEQIGKDALTRARLSWDRNLSILNTIGNNAPFVGLFGTVLGIIKAFHDLSQQAAQTGGAQGVTAGISEALVATAVGLLVAIPAVAAYNLFLRRVKNAAARAEALKSFLIGQIGQKQSK